MENKIIDKINSAELAELARYAVGLNEHIGASSEKITKAGQNYVISFAIPCWFIELEKGDNGSVCNLTLKARFSDQTKQFDNSYRVFFANWLAVRNVRYSFYARGAVLIMANQINLQNGITTHHLMQEILDFAVTSYLVAETYMSNIKQGAQLDVTDIGPMEPSLPAITAMRDETSGAIYNGVAISLDQILSDDEELRQDIQPFIP